MPQRGFQQPASHPRKVNAPDFLSSPEATGHDLNPMEALTGPSMPSKLPPPSMLHLHSILLPHLSASLPPLLGQLQSTRHQLLERKEDLVSGEPAIRDEMARLEAVKNVSGDKALRGAE